MKLLKITTLILLLLLVATSAFVKVTKKPMKTTGIITRKVEFPNNSRFISFVKSAYGDLRIENREFSEAYKLGDFVNIEGTLTFVSFSWKSEQNSDIVDFEMKKHGALR